MQVPHALRYAKSAGVASKRNAGRFNVEGELVTYAQIGARLGVSETAAGSRLKREQQQSGPVTWEGLGR